ncbi:MAG: hypothetical protein WC632_00640 [Candidatus Margulisiibacteriota bacterium]
MIKPSQVASQVLSGKIDVKTFLQSLSGQVAQVKNWARGRKNEKRPDPIKVHMDRWKLSSPLLGSIDIPDRSIKFPATVMVKFDEEDDKKIVRLFDKEGKKLFYSAEILVEGIKFSLKALT